jgi:hypothetical protein
MSQIVVDFGVEEEVVILGVSLFVLGFAVSKHLRKLKARIKRLT